jgi:hypothetical protein
MVDAITARIFVAVAYTQSDIDTLRAAIATGALEVTFGAGPDQRTVRWRTLAEMRSVLAEMETAVNGASVTPSPRVSYASHQRD